MENVSRIVMREKISPANMKKILSKTRGITEEDLKTLLDYI